MRLTTGLTACMILLSATLEAQAPAKESRNDWHKIEAFPRGEVIAVASDSGAVIRGRLLRADADSILIYAPRVDTANLKPIEQLSRHDPRWLAEVDRTALLIESSNLLISTEGISKKGVPIAAFDDVFATVARVHVVSVVQPKDERPAAWGTFAGAAAGGAAGWFTGLMIGLHDDGRCSPACGGRNLAIGTAWIGGPILGAALGHSIAKPREDLVIYRR